MRPRPPFVPQASSAFNQVCYLHLLRRLGPIWQTLNLQPALLDSLAVAALLDVVQAWNRWGCGRRVVQAWNYWSCGRRVVSK